MLAVASAAAVVVSLLLPWHHSGGVRRNAFELAQVADALGLVDDAGRRALYVGVFVLPLLSALTLAGVLAGLRRSAGIAACTVGAVGLTAAFVAIEVVGSRRPGPFVAGAAAMVAGLGGLRLVLPRKDVRHV